MAAISIQQLSIQQLQQKTTALSTLNTPETRNGRVEI